MILYLAGNFNNFVYPAVEKRLKDYLEGLGHDYQRLVSFYYQLNTDTDEKAIFTRQDPMTVFNLITENKDAIQNE